MISQFDYIPWDLKANYAIVLFCSFTVTCTAGAYIKDHVCVKCLVGYYQDLPAQASCKGCPDGYTTSDTGTVTATECSGGC